MVKLSMMMMLVLELVVFAMVMMIMTPLAHGHINPDDQSPEAVEHWFKKLPHAKEKLTKLHFYLHDTYSGNKPTDVPVAQANITSKSPTFFGMVNIIDDPMTVGPEPDLKVVGYAQGLYATASQEDSGLLVTLNFVFTNGKYNGSTLSVVGRSPYLHKYRELPILGGSGVFRLARGIAAETTYWLNDTTGDAIIEYHVFVIHY